MVDLPMIKSLICINLSVLDNLPSINWTSLMDMLFFHHLPNLNLNYLESINI